MAQVTAQSGKKYKIKVTPKPKFVKGFWVDKEKAVKINTASFGDTIALRFETKDIPTKINEIEVKTKEYDPVIDDIIETLKANRVDDSEVFQAELKLRHSYYLEGGKEEESEYIFMPSVKINGRKVEETFPEKKEDMLIVNIPKFIDGRWISWRDKNESYEVDEPFKYKIKKTAFGMKTTIRIKAKNIPKDVERINIEIREEDVFSDDVVESGIRAEKIKVKDNFSIFEADALIRKNNYFEDTGKECTSEFYFVPSVNFYRNKIEKKLPEDKKEYLRITPPGDYNEQVVQIAKLYSSGGYKWVAGSDGVPESIYFKDQEILTMPADKKTYCCGFTFWVAMRVLESNRLIDEMTVNEIKTFQKQFFGSAPTPQKKLCAYAIPTLGVGKEIVFDRCKEGDFVQLWRTNGSGHSVIFYKWIINKNNNNKIGFEYYGTQTATGGMGLHEEYFSGSGGDVNKGSTYAARIEG